MALTHGASSSSIIQGAMIWHVHNGTTAVLLERVAGRFSPRLLKLKSEHRTSLVRLEASVQRLWFAMASDAVAAAVQSARDGRSDVAIIHSARPKVPHRPK